MLLRAFICLLILAMPARATPNIVLILADDFSMNLMLNKNGEIHASMPNLALMVQDGMTFNQYIVSNSLCCPSRTSLLTGLLPHNSGVLTNTYPEGGYTAFTENANETKTFATVLRAYGYKTAFMGKYLNGWLVDQSPIPVGWDEFASTSKGYRGFHYVLNNNGVLSSPTEHFTDMISALGTEWMGATSQPFFLELASFSPHAPYTPPDRYKRSYRNYNLPKTPAFGARPAASAPQWLQIIPPLRADSRLAYQENFTQRIQAGKGIDDMIGAVRARLAELGLSDTTYVIFTSDNGFHMGEMSLRPGKMSPFDMDSRVPFVIVGPGIAPGSSTGDLVQNIDLAPTFAELAGAPPMADVDGRSMVPLFSGAVSTRQAAVIEHWQRPFDPDDPDFAEPRAGEPPTYTALRLMDAMYVEYDTGEVGYYDLTTDPDELFNIVAILPPERLAELHAALLANQGCNGTGVCQAAQDLTDPVDPPPVDPPPVDPPPVDPPPVDPPPVDPPAGDPVPVDPPAELPA